VAHIYELQLEPGEKREEISLRSLSNDTHCKKTAYLFKEITSSLQKYVQIHSLLMYFILNMYLYLRLLTIFSLLF